MMVICDLCVGPVIAAQLPERVVYDVYYVRGGGANFERAVTRVVRQKRSDWRSVGPEKEGTGGNVAPSAQRAFAEPPSQSRRAPPQSAFAERFHKASL